MQFIGVFLLHSRINLIIILVSSMQTLQSAGVSLHPRLFWCPCYVYCYHRRIWRVVKVRNNANDFNCAMKWKLFFFLTTLFQTLVVRFKMLKSACAHISWKFLNSACQMGSSKYLSPYLWCHIKLCLAFVLDSYSKLWKVVNKQLWKVLFLRKLCNFVLLRCLLTKLVCRSLSNSCNLLFFKVLKALSDNMFLGVWIL